MAGPRLLPRKRCEWHESLSHNVIFRYANKSSRRLILNKIPGETLATHGQARKLKIKKARRGAGQNHRGRLGDAKNSHGRLLLLTMVEFRQ